VRARVAVVILQLNRPGVLGQHAGEESLGLLERGVGRARCADDLGPRSGLTHERFAARLTALVLLAPEAKRGHVGPCGLDELPVGSRAGVSRQVRSRPAAGYEGKRNGDHGEQASRS